MPESAYSMESLMNQTAYNKKLTQDLQPRGQHPRSRPSFECIASLRGSGALGAYQAGVYQALAEARLDPDWVAGISIGAINAAVIAGNTPEAKKLRQLWELVTAAPLWANARPPVLAASTTAANDRGT
jgi:predicted acylesterase/phospholipase RssA